MFIHRQHLSFFMFTIMLMIQQSTPISASSAGELDSSFGDMGRMITNMKMFPNSVLLQSDGKILIAATYWKDYQNTDIWLLRFHANGQIDNSFGIGGQVITDISSGLTDGPSAMTIQPDGKILVAGGGRVLLRYLPNGELDPLFDQDGILSFDFGYGESINATRIVPDDRILMIGVSEEMYYSNSLVLARFLPDGKLDTSFGNEGKVVYESYGEFQIKGVLIMPDDRFIVGGSFYIKQGDDGTLLMRFLQNGYLDENFGSQGRVYINPELTSALAIQTDGKIVTAGDNYIGYAGLNLMRFTSNGSLDPTFGSNGKVYQPSTGFGEFFYAIQLQVDGKILISGQAEQMTGYDFLLRRYLPDGSLDLTFGSNGKVITDFLGEFDLANHLQMYPDGRILAVGSTIDDEGYQLLCAARYLNDFDTFFQHVWLPVIER